MTSSESFIYRYRKARGENTGARGPKSRARVLASLLLAPCSLPSLPAGRKVEGKEGVKTRSHLRIIPQEGILKGKCQD